MIDGVSEYKYSILVCVNKILFDSLYLKPSPCFMLKFSVKFLGRIWVLSMANMSMGYMPIFVMGNLNLSELMCIYVQLRNFSLTAI